MKAARDMPVKLVSSVRALDATTADLAQLYADRRDVLVETAARLCGDDDAADFMQDAFLCALQRVGTARQYWPLETWMFSIMIAESRRRPVTARASEAQPPTAVHETGDGDPRIAAVRSLLGTLPPRQREVAFLRYFADLDEASIATRLGIHRGTVASVLHRVRERLRRAIETT